MTSISRSVARSSSPFVQLTIGFSLLVLLLRLFTLPHSLVHVLLFKLYLPLLSSGQVLAEGASLGEALIHGGMQILICTIALFYVLLVLASGIYLVNHFRRNRARAVTPLLIHGVTIFLLIYASDLVIKPFFKLNYGAYQAAVEQIQTQLTDSTSPQKEFSYDNRTVNRVSTLQLPPTNQQLSIGFRNPGEVQTVTDGQGTLKSVVFFRQHSRFRGEPGYTAFVYTPTQIDRLSLSQLFGVADLTFYIGIEEMNLFDPQWSWVDVVED